MRVLLDTNVLLDLLLRRGPWLSSARAVLDAGRDGRLAVAVSALSLATVFYIGRKQVGTAAALQIVRDCLSSFEVLTVDRAALSAAAGMSGPDFEDNIQVACAAAAGVDAVVTRDPAGFSGSAVPVLSPEELAARLTLPPSPPLSAPAAEPPPPPPTHP
jgi:predicted nucleic acid-binding protein